MKLLHLGGEGYSTGSSLGHAFYLFCLKTREAQAEHENNMIVTNKKIKIKQGPKAKKEKKNGTQTADRIS